MLGSSPELERHLRDICSVKTRAPVMDRGTGYELGGRKHEGEPHERSVCARS